jgi:ABC-type siderophore export system fused ATPase/permease subunit
LVAYAISKNLLTTITDELVLNLRKKTYRSIINKPIEFFEDSKNSSGNLTSLLSSEIEDVNGASMEHYLIVYEGVLCMFA